MLPRLQSLKTALLVPFAALILGVASVIGVLSYQTGASAIDELAKRRADDILARIELATDLHIQDSQLVLGTLNANVISGSLDMKSLAAVEKHLWHIAGLTESIGYVYFANPRGDFVGVERFADGRVNVRVRDAGTDGIRHSYLAKQPGDRERIIFNQSGAYDPRTRPWYKLAIEQKKATWTPVYVSDARGNLKMTRAMPLYHKGELTGVVATDVTLTHLSDFLRGLPISANGVAFITEANGSLIANSTPEAPFTKGAAGGDEMRMAARDSPNRVIRATAEAMMPEKRRAAAANLRSTIDTPDGAMLVSSRPFGHSGLNWSTTVSIPRADVLGSIAGNVQATIVICIIAALVALMIGYAILGWVNRGLDPLVAAAHQIGAGKWEQPLPFQHSAEIGELAHAFDSMAQRLKRSVATIAAQNEQLEDVNRTLEARVIERSQHIAKISNLVEQTDDGFLVTDVQGVITYVNPAWERISGYSSMEALGNKPSLVKSYQHDNHFYANMWKVLQAGRVFRSIFTNRRRDGEIYYSEMTITPMRDAHGVPSGYVSVEKDVTEREKLRQEINYLAHFDSLTALANRATLMKRLEAALNSGNRHRDSGHTLAVLYMDLNLFKAVNDAHGHEAGDAVLAEVGHRLRQCVRDGDTAARVGGDEFVALLPDLRDPDDAEKVARKIEETIAQPIRVRGVKHLIGVSIGIALAPRDGSDAEALLRHADQAMYSGKRSARA